MNSSPPIEVRHLFAPLDKKLIEVLTSLTEEQWMAQTVAREWTVKDVAAHLLDGNLRALSQQRDGYFGIHPPTGADHAALITWLNAMNREWVVAAKRLSPSVLLLLLEMTGPLTTAYYTSVDPWEEAIFPVSWAGQQQSKAWMHIAREYTEKWLHQQQIRDAVGLPGLFSPDFFLPLMNTFLQALPHTYSHTEAADGATIRLAVRGEAEACWVVKRTGGQWQLAEEAKPRTEHSDAEVLLDANAAWKLFSKSLRKEDLMNEVEIKGNRDLGAIALDMVSVMA